MALVGNVQAEKLNEDTPSILKGNVSASDSASDQSLEQNRWVLIEVYIYVYMCHILFPYKNPAPNLVNFVFALAMPVMFHCVVYISTSGPMKVMWKDNFVMHKMFQCGVVISRYNRIVGYIFSVWCIKLILQREK